VWFDGLVLIPNADRARWARSADRNREPLLRTVEVGRISAVVVHHPVQALVEGRIPSLFDRLYHWELLLRMLTKALAFNLQPQSRG
jgi:hypothetical protein